MESARTQQDYWCTTTFGDNVKTSFTWKIENFKSRTEKFQEKITSSIFFVTGSDNRLTKWCFHVYPKGDEEDLDCVAVYLISKNDFPVTASWDGFVLGENENDKAKSGVHIFEAKDSRIGFSGFIEHVDLSDNLLPGCYLTLVFEITVYGQGKTLSGSKYSNDSLCLRQDQGQKQLCENLGQVLADKELSDIELRCGETAFPCHQLILRARSPVFRAMFQTEMKEKQTKKIDIEDATPELVAEMLNFIYTGTISNNQLEEMASGLLGVANKYQLNDLKNMCEDKLCATLEVSNSIEYLVIGDLHNAFKLKQFACALVAENISKIVDTDVFKDLLRQQPDLAWEVIKVKTQEDVCDPKNKKIKLT